MRSRARRRPISSFVSPGPRPPMPPVRRESESSSCDEARQQVLELRQLDLQLAVARLRALREDVEDELRAVDDLEVGRFGDRAHLRGRELAVEDDQVCAELQRADEQVVELALAEHGARVDGLTRRWMISFEDDDARRGAPARAARPSTLRLRTTSRS